MEVIVLHGRDRQDTHFGFGRAQGRQGAGTFRQGSGLIIRFGMEVRGWGVDKGHQQIDICQGRRAAAGAFVVDCRGRFGLRRRVAGDAGGTVPPDAFSGLFSVWLSLASSSGLALETGTLGAQVWFVLLSGAEILGSRRLDEGGAGNRGEMSPLDADKWPISSPGCNTWV